MAVSASCMFSPCPFRFPLRCRSHVPRCATPKRSQSSRKPHVPSTDAIIPKHGFCSGLFGRLTRSFGSGGRGRWVTDFAVEEPDGLGTMMRDGIDGELTMDYREIRRDAMSIGRRCRRLFATSSGGVRHLKKKGASPHQV